MKVLDRISPRAAKGATLALLVLGLGLVAAALYLTFGVDRGTTVTTYSMGSYVQQTVYGKNQEEAAQQAASAVTQLEELISWRKEDSDAARLNQAAGEDFLEIDGRTYEILETSLAVCEASGGAFDVTIAPLSRLWDFDGTPSLPEDSQIQEMKSRVDYTSLSLLEDGTAALRKKGTALDLGAVGKGAACDAAVDAYAAADVSGIVSVGGSVGVFGDKPDGSLWRIALRDPESQGSLGTLSIGEGFVSTSGSYEKQFTQDGVTYHHLLDPAIGYPAESGLVSVTVWSQSGTLSDALSTACFVLGMEESLPLLEEFEAEAIFIDEEHNITATAGFGNDSFQLESGEYTLDILPAV